MTKTYDLDRRSGHLLRVRLDGAKSTLRVVLATALAEAALASITNLEESGLVLSDAHRITIVTQAIMVYSTSVLDGEGSLDIEAALDEAVARSSGE